MAGLINYLWVIRDQDMITALGNRVGISGGGGRNCYLGMPEGVEALRNLWT
jgi:hypothetical protein